MIKGVGNMNIKHLSTEDVSDIFKNSMQFDFPQNEIRPLSNIKKLMQQNLYPCYGLYVDGVLKAYAFFCHALLGDCLLLDYYAVTQTDRSKGYGSIFLKNLQETLNDFSGIIVELESINAAKNETERLERERRISFYERNGMQKTGIFSNLFDVEFDIFYLPIKKEWDDSFVYRELDKIYDAIFPKVLRGKKVFLSYR